MFSIFTCFERATLAVLCMLDENLASAKMMWYVYVTSFIWKYVFEKNINHRVSLIFCLDCSVGECP